MAILFRWLLRVTAALIFLIALGIGLVYFLASQSLPDYSSTVETPGITTPVEIVRDHSNVPHILGENDPDVYFGLGYAHAQDRLWQMTILRRTAQGRLSEIFGQRTVKIDRLIRRLDIYRLAQQSVASQDAETLDALRSYAAGVNARLAEINHRALGRGAPEMFIFNAPVAPWQPGDSLAIVKLMGLRLSVQLEAEVLRARTSLMLDDADRLKDILPDVPGSGIAALPEYAKLFPNLPRYAQGSDLPASPLSPIPENGLASASNAWSAAPSRSASGGTLLASDPHLGFSAPSIWYLARLELGTGGVIGGTIPGIPVVMTGRSARLGGRSSGTWARTPCASASRRGRSATARRSSRSPRGCSTSGARLASISRSTRPGSRCPRETLLALPSNT